MAIDSYTKLLLHFNGPQDSTVFRDSGVTGHTETVIGDPNLSIAWSHFGPSSGRFYGSGDGVTFPNHADWDRGAGHYTIDAWIRLSAVGVEQWIVGKGSPPVYYQIGFFVNSSNYLCGRCDKTSGPTIFDSVASNLALSIFTEYHVAMVINRTTNKIQLFVNAVETTYSTQDTIDGTAYTNSNALIIGAKYADASVGEFNGRIDELRLSKGITRWTTDFTLPIYEYGTELISGSLDGQLTTTGILSISKEISGSISNSSSANGTLTVETKIAGTVAITSSVVGTLGIERWLVGTIAATSNIPNTTLWTGTPISGSLGATSSVTGALSVSMGLAGTIAAVCTTDAYLEADAIKGSLAAVCNVPNALLSVTRELIGTIAPTCTISSITLGSIKEFIVTTTALSGFTAALDVTRELIGTTVITQSVVTGSLVIMRVETLSGIVSSGCSPSGRLEVSRELIGNISTQVTTSGQIKVLRELIGTVACAVSVSGTIINIVSVSRTTTLTSTVTGTVKTIRTVIAITPCASTVVALLSTIRLLSGLVAAQSSLTGSMPVFARPLFIIPTSIRIQPILASGIRVNAGLKRDWYAIANS